MEFYEFLHAMFTPRYHATAPALRQGVRVTVKRREAMHTLRQTMARLN